MRRRLGTLSADAHATDRGLRAVCSLCERDTMKTKPGVNAEQNAGHSRTGSTDTKAKQYREYKYPRNQTAPHTRMSRFSCPRNIHNNIPHRSESGRLERLSEEVRPVISGRN